MADTDDTPTLNELAELLQRDAPPVTDVPFALTAPTSRARRATPAPSLPFGESDDAE